MDPNYGYLSGAANVIGAQSQFMISEEQRNLMREQTKQAKLDTQRKTLEQWRYEQKMMPTAAEIQARQDKAALDRALNNPPSVDIWSGVALNTLLSDIQKMQSQAGSGPTVLIDPALLPKVNLTDGTSFGQGMLKQAAQLTWPFALEFNFFQAGRKRMDQAMSAASAQIQSGKRADPKLVQEMLSAEDDLRLTLREHIHDLTPSQGIEARRYLNDLHETIRTFQDPNAANYVSGKWAPRGNTVGELVANMTSQGLRFAPVTPGNEFAYTSLYQSLLNYNRGLSQLVRR
jgi:hypothetical protein